MHVVPRASDGEDWSSVSFPDSFWEVLDTVDLQEVFQCEFSVLQRGRFRRAGGAHAVHTEDHQGEIRGWKLFCLLPMLFLRRGSGSKVTKEVLCHRFDLFTSGEWSSLLHEANIPYALRRGPCTVRKPRSEEPQPHARKCSWGSDQITTVFDRAALALGNVVTLREMQSRRQQQVQRLMPRQVLEFQVDRNMFVNSKMGRRGSSPGPGRCTYEHLRGLLDDAGTFDLFFEAISSLALATVPEEVGAVFTGARPTALAKPGCSRDRKRVLSTEACRQNHCQTVCSQVRKGMRTFPIRLVDEGWHSAATLSIDGIGAYDYVLRIAMLERLLRMPAARAIFPFVRLSHTSRSSYSWWDDEGIRHNVTQAEGREQGDPLMPLLFSIATQGALEERRVAARRAIMRVSR